MWLLFRTALPGGCAHFSVRLHCVSAPELLHRDRSPPISPNALRVRWLPAESFHHLPSKRFRGSRHSPKPAAAAAPEYCIASHDHPFFLPCATAPHTVL